MPVVLSGGVVAFLALGTSGSAPARTATAPALAADSPSGQVLASSSPSGPAPGSSAPAANAPGSGAQPQASPPVVDGVRRTDVGSAHSPRLLQQLSGSRATTPPPADAGALGVDVADYQHPNGTVINWPQVAAAGYRFAFIKATEGGYYVNPYHASDLAQAKAAGLYATDYHFAIPNVSGGVSQADYAVQNGDYTADGRTLPLTLDIEYNPYGSECYGLSAAQMVSWLGAFTAEAQRLTGQQTILYTTADWWRTCTGDSTAFGSDPLWVAAYRNGSPPMPAGWANWTFWQFTSQASVPGIAGNVDVSYFLRAALQLLDPGNQQDAAGTAVQLQVGSLNAADGQPPDFTASNLPPGLSINGSGMISGTISPTASGRYGVTVAATYPSGGMGTVSFTWTVTSASASPSPSSSPSPSASPSASPSPADSPSPAASPSPSASPSASDSASPSPSASPSASPSPSDSPSPSPSPSLPDASPLSASASPSASPSSP